MENICCMLQRLSEQYPRHQWIFPVHLNPAVREPVYRLLGHCPNVLLTDPVDYHSSLYLISQATLILSDSGGIQEEAPIFGTPVVVMRRHTERMEGVKAGFATLAGQDPEVIEAVVRTWLDDDTKGNRLKELANPYGDGRAAERIIASLLGNPIKDFNG
jgi:UDP-N-acetylglucosamine 2-epimerase (non-hydrolysing)